MSTELALANAYETSRGGVARKTLTITETACRFANESRNERRTSLALL